MKINSQSADTLLKTLGSDELVQTVESVAAQTWFQATHQFISGGFAFKPRTGVLEKSIAIETNTADADTVSASAPYAPLVEFGSKRSAKFPFLWADVSSREAQVTEKVSQALNETLNG